MFFTAEFVVRRPWRPRRPAVLIGSARDAVLTSIVADEHQVVQTKQVDIQLIASGSAAARR